MLYFKTMFFILRSVLEVEDFPNIKELTWNYTKTGHGKGAPEGVRGSLIVESPVAEYFLTICNGSWVA
jgi:hypothetical protein